MSWKSRIYLLKQSTICFKTIMRINTKDSQEALLRPNCVCVTSQIFPHWHVPFAIGQGIF